MTPDSRTHNSLKAMLRTLLLAIALSLANGEHAPTPPPRLPRPLLATHKKLRRKTQNPAIYARNS